MPADDVLFYDPQRFAIHLFNFPTSGYGADTMIEVEPKSPVYGEKISLDGQVTRYMLSDRRVGLKLTLMQSSRTNALLSAQLDTDQRTPNGFGVGRIILEDLQSGGTVIEGNGWIVGWPKQVWGKEPNEWVWELTIADARIRLMGN